MQLLCLAQVSIGCPEKMEPITKISHIPASRWALSCSLCKECTGTCIQVCVPLHPQYTHTPALMSQLQRAESVVPWEMGGCHYPLPAPRLLLHIRKLKGLGSVGLGRAETAHSSGGIIPPPYLSGQRTSTRSVGNSGFGVGICGCDRHACTGFLLAIRLNTWKGWESDFSADLVDSPDSGHCHTALSPVEVPRLELPGKIGKQLAGPIRGSD